MTGDSKDPVARRLWITLIVLSLMLGCVALSIVLLKG